MNERDKVNSPAKGKTGVDRSEPKVKPESEESGNDAEIVSRQIDYHGTYIHYLSAGPANAASLLLLHGASFHSGTWQKVGTIRFMASRGYRVLALDLPGFGESGAAGVDQESFLEQVIPLLKIEKPVIVAPSMSGRFAFPLLLRHPEAMSGFVPVAPAAAPKYASKLARVEVPALIVWGDADTVFPPATAELLAKSFQNARVLILTGAGHACYLDQPDAFHQALLQFMKSIRK